MTQERTPAPSEPTNPATSETAPPPSQPSESLPTNCDASSTRYSLVVCTDGGWPIVKSFADPVGLAKEIAKYNNTDTVVWCFPAEPVLFTEGPQRHLLCGENAYRIPTLPTDPVISVPIAALPNLSDRLQSDGYLGDEIDAEFVGKVPASRPK